MKSTALVDVKHNRLRHRSLVPGDWMDSLLVSAFQRAISILAMFTSTLALDHKLDPVQAL
jgi:hypothetical protein